MIVPVKILNDLNSVLKDLKLPLVEPGQSTEQYKNAIARARTGARFKNKLNAARLHKVLNSAEDAVGSIYI